MCWPPAATSGRWLPGAGALPIILTATDIGFAYQPFGEANITGVGGVSVADQRIDGNLAT